MIHYATVCAVHNTSATVLDPLQKCYPPRRRPPISTPKTPLLSADIIIELEDRPERPIVLIERKNPPKGWAIPGGFVDVGESVPHAAVREAAEETGLDVHLSCILGVYSDPERDARGHTATVVFIANSRGVPVADDDAQSVLVCSMDNLPSPLAFDHAKILDDYRGYREQGRLPRLETAKICDGS